MPGVEPATAGETFRDLLLKRMEAILVNAKMKNPAAKAGITGGRNKKGIGDRESESRE